jgi:hypothetical protein
VTAVIVLVDAVPTGLAEMLAGLLGANLLRRPEREVLLRPAVIGIEAADAGVAITVRLTERRIEISNGAAIRGSDLRIRADGADLLALSVSPLRLGLPDPLTGEGRAILRRVASGRVRISGMLRHPIVLSRFARLLSVSAT